MSRLLIRLGLSEFCYERCDEEGLRLFLRVGFYYIYEVFLCR